MVRLTHVLAQGGLNWEILVKKITGVGVVAVHGVGVFGMGWQAQSWIFTRVILTLIVNGRKPPTRTPTLAG